MNLFKYHFNKKFLHNRKQPWIILTILVVVTAALYLYHPANQWLCKTIGDEFPLSTAICTFLFLNMLTARVFYVSQIKEGHTEARGCAGSSCLLTIILAVCLTALVIKGCKQPSTPSYQKSFPYTILKAEPLSPHSKGQ